MDLDRFVAAQESCFEDVVDELRAGAKQSHWMWFVFPQLRGLGSSPMAMRYGIRDADEARAYLEHPVLGPRLVQCCELVLMHPDRTAAEMFGGLDATKLRSCATLFDAVMPGAVFGEVLDVFFGGERDPLTVQRLADRGE